MNILGLVIIASTVLAGFFWYQRQPPKKRFAAIIKLILLQLALVLLYLVITGKLSWLFGLAGLLIPLLRRFSPLLLQLLPGLLKRKANQNITDSGRNERTTESLKVFFDQQSGVVYGIVTKGRLQGRELGSLTEEEFIQLLTDFRHSDTDSALLLEQYLDKRFGKRWREDDHSSTTTAKSDMSVEQALDVLGLNEKCTIDDITIAHRRMIQRVHPDRGGSDYLAAQINQAKDCLLKSGRY